MTTRGVLVWLQTTFGGNLTCQPSRPSVHRWELFGQAAVTFLQMVDPWLRVKAHQARIILALDWDAALTPDVISRREQGRRTISALNTGGHSNFKPYEVNTC